MSEPENLLWLASMFAEGLIKSQTEVAEWSQLHPVGKMFQKVHSSLCITAFVWVFRDPTTIQQGIASHTHI